MQEEHERREQRTKEQMSHVELQNQKLVLEVESKNRILEENYSIIRSKEVEMKNLVDFRNITQNEEYGKMKDYNVKLTQQLEEITSQFNRCHQELREQSDQASKNRSSINNL